MLDFSGHGRNCITSKSNYTSIEICFIIRCYDKAAGLNRTIAVLKFLMEVADAFAGMESKSNYSSIEIFQGTQSCSQTATGLNRTIVVLKYINPEDY